MPRNGLFSFEQWVIKRFKGTPTYRESKTKNMEHQSISPHHVASMVLAKVASQLKYYYTSQRCASCVSQNASSSSNKGSSKTLVAQAQTNTEGTRYKAQGLISRTEGTCVHCTKACMCPMTYNGTISMAVKSEMNALLEVSYVCGHSCSTIRS